MGTHGHIAKRNAAIKKQRLDKNKAALTIVLIRVTHGHIAKRNAAIKPYSTYKAPQLLELAWASPLWFALAFSSSPTGRSNTTPRTKETHRSPPRAFPHYEIEESTHTTFNKLLTIHIFYKAHVLFFLITVLNNCLF